MTDKKIKQANQANKNKVQMILPIVKDLDGLTGQYYVYQLICAYDELKIDILYDDEHGVDGLKVSYSFDDHEKVHRVFTALYTLGLVGEKREEETED